MLIAILGIAIFASITIDLFVINKEAHAISIKEALWQSLFWITFSLSFGGLVYLTKDAEAASAFYSAFLIEKMLSVDNLFVFMLIFSFFKTPDEYKHRILMYGIVGAIVFRAIFIFAGAAIIEHFDFILYFFGALLIYMGVKTATQGEEDDNDIENSLAVKVASKIVRVVPSYANGKLVCGGAFSLMMLVILAIEFADIIFAIDSVPAAFGVTRDPFIIYSANICAILGLRALFFLLDAVSDYLKYLNMGVGVILSFIGAKMLLPLVGVHIENITSLIVISSILTVTTAVSLLGARSKKL